MSSWTQQQTDELIGEKHPWIIEYEETVEDLNDSRLLHDDTDFEEEVFEDMVEKYGSEWHGVWENNKRRDLLGNYYRLSRGGINEMGKLVFAWNYVMTYAQKRALRDSGIGNEQFINEKGPMYEEYRQEWNLKLGFEAFLPKVRAEIPQTSEYNKNEEIIMRFTKGKAVPNRDALEARLHENIAMLQEVLQAVQDNKKITAEQVNTVVNATIEEQLYTLIRERNSNQIRVYFCNKHAFLLENRIQIDDVESKLDARHFRRTAGGYYETDLPWDDVESILEAVEEFDYNTRFVVRVNRAY